MINPDISYFRAGYNCAQTVLMNFAPQLGIPSEEIAPIAAAFGSGMSRTGQVCGAVSGALMVIGLRYGLKSAPDQETKDNITRITRKFFEEFEQRNQTPICNELLGIDLGPDDNIQYARESGLFLQRCPKFMGDAIEIVDQLIHSQEPTLY